ncbi:MAG: AraC family transcriptional regulator [Frondihabitans sp.]|nr:AraC family transcriptional regulator [Frondihabitans sp.]
MKYDDVAENEPFHPDRPISSEMSLPVAPIRDRMPTIAQFGIAVETFPSYVNTTLDLHGLDVVLLTFVLSGHGRHVIGDVEYEVTAPSVGVTRTGEQHSLVTDDSSLDVVNVYLDTRHHPLPRLSSPLDVALSALIPFSAGIVDHEKPLKQVSLSDGKEIRTLLDLLLAETTDPRAGTGDVLDSLRRLLVTACARAVLDGGLLPERRDLTPVDETIENIRAYLDRTFAESHSLASLAEMAHLERTYFSRTFSQRVGVPVTEYVARLRIRYAVFQLQSTDAAVADIAAASGFRDLSHFGRTFRRITETTPRAHRRWYRSLRDV